MSKVLISKSRRIIFGHEISDILMYRVIGFPVPPKPFGFEAGHTVDSKMNENANFSVVIPLRKKSLTIFKRENSKFRLPEAVV